MSRIGKKPIVIPDGVNVEIADGRVTVSKGQESLSQEILPGITVTIEDSKVLVGREDDTRQTRALHGLTRSLINNMVVGYTRDSRRIWKSMVSDTVRRKRAISSS